MPERSEYAPGTPSWVDLATPDLAASEQFYGTLFGWSFDAQDTGDSENPYVLAEQDGKAIAGMMRLTPEMQSGGMPPVWSTYVTVTDVDATAVKAKELGGEAADKMPVPGHGWFSACRDTEGNAFHIWQADSSAGQ